MIFIEYVDGGYLLMIATVLSEDTFAMVNFSEEGHRANHFYQSSIFETRKSGAQRTWKWTRKSGKRLFFLIKAGSKHMLT